MVYTSIWSNSQVSGDGLLWPETPTYATPNAASTSSSKDSSLMQTLTEYGSWEQWARRIDELIDEGRPGIIGARCSIAHVARKAKCPDCTDAYLDWLSMNRHPGGKEVTHEELGRSMAGLPQNAKNPARGGPRVSCT